LVALNKADLLLPKEVQERTAELTGFGLPVLAVSAAQKQGLSEMVDALFSLVEAAPKPGLEAPSPKPPEADYVRVTEVEEGVYALEAPQLQRHLDRLKGDPFEASGYLQDLFKRYRIEAALKKRGVRAGDTVRFGEQEFEYIPEV
jgi:GTP-binding protein